MNAPGTDKTFIQNLKASDSFCETYLNQFQISVALYQTVVRKQINGKLYPLGREDCVYKKVLNALLQRSPVMRHSYNQLLQRKIKNHAISITVKDAFYPEPDEAEFPL